MIAQFSDCNTERSRAAAARTVEQAARAIARIEALPPATTAHGAEVRRKHLEALRLRVAHPGSTLAEIAAEAGLSKDAYWRKFARALNYGRNK